MIIYKVTNKINGKIYIGKTTTTLENRTKQHKRSAIRKSKTAFHSAINKYGEENFIFECLDYCDTKEKLNELEKHYIILLNSKSPIGYNLTNGGDGNSKGQESAFKGKKHTEETKEKIREKRKFQVFSEETRKKMSESRKGKPSVNKGKISWAKGLTKETDDRIKWGESLKGKPSGMKGKEAWNKGLKGINTGFKKGNIPWNKGLKGIHCNPATEFKKGNIPWNKTVVV